MQLFFEIADVRDSPLPLIRAHGRYAQNWAKLGSENDPESEPLGSTFGDAANPPRSGVVGRVSRTRFGTSVGDVCRPGSDVSKVDPSWGQLWTCQIEPVGDVGSTSPTGSARTRRSGQIGRVRQGQFGVSWEGWIHPSPGHPFGTRKLTPTGVNFRAPRTRKFEHPRTLKF